MKLYIAGPITGVSDYKENFAKMEQIAKDDGYDVINPARILCEMPESTTHKEYMEVCFTLLTQADAVIFLKGWENSIGAKMEFDFATRSGKTICFEAALA